MVWDLDWHLDDQVRKVDLLGRYDVCIQWGKATPGSLDSMGVVGFIELSRSSCFGVNVRIRLGFICHIASGSDSIGAVHLLPMKRVGHSDLKLRTSERV